VASVSKWIEVDSKVHEMLRGRQFSEAEAFLMQCRSEFREAGENEDLEYVAGCLARFYFMPDTEDRPKAERFYLEAEELSKNAHSKLQTATFYFYVLRNFRKTIGKIDEIGGLRKQPVDPDYYSGLSLKGQALIETNDLQEVVQVLEEMQTMTEAPQARLPYGDEINFLERAISNPLFETRCGKLLITVIPRMRSSEYDERAKILLG
jgi:hypothetical protein